MKPILLFIAICIAAPLAAAPQQAMFSSRAVVVRVDVFATDKGKPVAGLTAADFELLDNGVPQRITLADSDALPANVVLALDTSASTSGQSLQDLVSAGEQLLDDLKPNEPAGMTTFSRSVNPRVALTTNHGEVRDVLRRVTPLGDTSAIDGIYVAMMSAQHVDGRPLVVVFTDGVDTASWLQSAELIDAARRASAVVYTVATGDARNWSLLKQVSDTTGGRAIELESSKDLRAEFQRILAEFRSRYFVSFTPTGVTDTGYHKLTVRSTRRGVDVKARPGYQAER